MKDYALKFEAMRSQTAFERLSPEDQACVKQIALRYRLTFQELKQVSETALDLAMWQETPLSQWWTAQEEELTGQGNVGKDRALKALRQWIVGLLASPKSYPDAGIAAPKPARLTVIEEETDKTIMGHCPVASEATVCCNLHTIDAVESCGFGCSYCTIQTFYDREVKFDARFREKLRALTLEPDRYYHIGTGQASDSLMWGNQFGVLDALCEFASDHPNVILELKTKSANIGYFRRTSPPLNLVISWSLNTDTIIRNEEHLTANLDERLGAARTVVDRGIRVAFHFHPMVFYDHWRRDYASVGRRLLETFHPSEVAFLSLGSTTFIKPVIKALRERGVKSKMLQMEMVPDPKGKLTYPDPVKVEMFRHLLSVLQPWHDQVFTYLCMEKAAIWTEVFGRVYSSNHEFEEDFVRQVGKKLGGKG